VDRASLKYRRQRMARAVGRGQAVKAVAAEYGVSLGTVYRALYEAGRPTKVRGAMCWSLAKSWPALSLRKPTKQQMRIAYLLLWGYGPSEIARRLGTSRRYITMIRRRLAGLPDT